MASCFPSTTCAQLFPPMKCYSSSVVLIRSVDLGLMEFVEIAFTPIMSYRAHLIASVGGLRCET